MKVALEHLLICHPGTLNCPSPPSGQSPTASRSSGRGGARRGVQEWERHVGTFPWVRHGSETAGSAGSAFASLQSASHMFEGAAKENAELFPAVSFLPKAPALGWRVTRPRLGFRAQGLPNF